jgi:predicted DNA-binding protein
MSKRFNLLFDDRTSATLCLRASREGLQPGTYVKRLIETLLKNDEDKYWLAVARERQKNSSGKYYTFEEVKEFAENLLNPKNTQPKGI